MLNRTQIKRNIRQFISTDKCWVDMLVAGIVPILLSFCSICISYKNGYNSAFDGLNFYSGASSSVGLSSLVSLFTAPLSIAF